VIINAFYVEGVHRAALVPGAHLSCRILRRPGLQARLTGRTWNVRPTSVKSRVVREFTLAITFGVALLSPQQLPRVDTNEALGHVVSKVDPVVPTAVTVAKIGGNVIADITVRPDGSVESVTILSGAQPLHRPVTEALLRWKFRPFVKNGRPTRVITLIEISLPDPIRDEARQRDEIYLNAENLCQQALATTRNASVGPCSEVVRLSDQLPADRRIERSRALSWLGQSLLLNGRDAEGIQQLLRAIEVRRQPGVPDDADIGNLERIVALGYRLQNDVANAERYFAMAEATIEASIARSPFQSPPYSAALQAVLRDHAAFKRANGDESGARALETRAAAVAASTPSSRETTIRMVGALPCMGPESSRLTDADIERIRGLLPPKAEPWLCMSEGESVGAPEPGVRRISWLVQVYLQPDSMSPQLRRGRIVFVEALLPARSAFDKRGAWQIWPTAGTSYGQAPVSGRNPSDVTGEQDLNRPFSVTEGPNGERLTDEDLVGIVGLLRRSAERRSQGPPQVFTEVQPWAITDVHWDGQNAVSVHLLDPEPASTRGQLVLIRRSPNAWLVAQIRPF
jgi:TonB-like protein